MHSMVLKKVVKRAALAGFGTESQKGFDFLISWL